MFPSEPVWGRRVAMFCPEFCYSSSVEMGILAQFAPIDPDLCTLVPHLKVEVNGP